MTFQPKHVCFDWDGTLIDTHPVLIASYFSACEKLGVPKPSEDDIRACLGASAEDSIKQIFPDQSSQTTWIQDFLEAFRRSYQQSQIIPKLIPGVVELLQTMKDNQIKLTIASNKNEAILARELEQTKIAEYFTLVCSPPSFNAKPDCSMLKHILRTIDICASDSLMVGDHANDIIAAKTAGMRSLAVLTGSQTRESLITFNPNFISNDVIQGLEQFQQVYHLSHA